MGRHFAGLAYAHPLRISVRQAIESLEVIAKASDPFDPRNGIYDLPFEAQPVREGSGRHAGGDGSKAGNSQ